MGLAFVLVVLLLICAITALIAPDQIGAVAIGAAFVLLLLTTGGAFIER